MEIHDDLLKKVLNIHYHDRPQIMEKANMLIQNYCDKEVTIPEYEQVLKTVHDLMNDLPPNILLYFLTIIPIPKNSDSDSSIFSELMKKSRASLLDNMQSALTEYISNYSHSTSNSDTGKSETIAISEDKKLLQNEEHKTKTEVNTQKRKISDCDLYEPPRVRKATGHSKRNEKCTRMCLKLVEISADYVLANLNILRTTYHEKSKKVWSIVCKNTCELDEQVQCYKYIEDLNRKLKWLRMIEAGHISEDVIKELYANSEIFLKEKHLHNIIDESVFTLPEELNKAIYDFVNTK